MEEETLAVLFRHITAVHGEEKPSTDFQHKMNVNLQEGFSGSCEPITQAKVE